MGPFGRLRATVWGWDMLVPVVTPDEDCGGGRCGGPMRCGGGGAGREPLAVDEGGPGGGGGGGPLNPSW